MAGAIVNKRLKPETDARMDADGSRFIFISGCSGGGKSSLLAALKARGHSVVEEPGRRIVAEATAPDDPVLPWVDMAAFARRAIDLALADRAAAAVMPGLVFFDRGLIDAAAALEHATGEPALAALGASHRYHRQVFLTPPWPEIYGTDGARRHDLDAAMAEYEAYAGLGYALAILPRTDVESRADFVLERIGRGL